jgi:hypothetical protein
MMRVREIFQSISGFFKKVLIVELVILTLNSLFWWFATSRTKEGFISYLFISGAIAIVVGVLLRTGSREGTYGLTYQYFRSIGNTTRDERNNLDREDMHHSYTDLMVLFTAGIVAFILCILIDVIF